MYVLIFSTLTHSGFEGLGKGISLVKTEFTMGLNFQGWQKDNKKSTKIKHKNQTFPLRQGDGEF